MWQHPRMLGVFLLLFAGARLEAAAPTPAIVLWDTSAPQAELLQPENRSAWKAVPSDLLLLESNPAKASSDPGFYGRDYVFRGDAVVENRRMAAVFGSGEGRVVLYAKDLLAPKDGDLRESASLGVKVAELAPLGLEHARISHLEILRNADDTVVLEATFASAGSGEVSCVFSFGKAEILGIKPSATMKGMSVRSPLRYAVAPSFIGDDLIFSPSDYPSDAALTLPAENLLVGLLDAEQAELVMTWPTGKQSVKLKLGKGSAGGPAFGELEFENDGRPFYLAALSAAGIWHHETLLPSFLEKDVPLPWQAPFPAKWKTQLYEEGVKTSFAFRASKGEIWRGVPGSYEYPAWFEGGKALFHLSKKVAPKGDAVIYFLEGQDTPYLVPTPAGILEDTLGREASEPMLDLAGRKLRTHHRRGGEGVRRACTCGCTEAIQAVFESGEEVARKPYIEGAVDDMIYFVHRHVERIHQYRQFAADLNGFLEAQAKAEPALKPFIDSLQTIAAQIPQEYEVQKDNMKSFDYADDLARRTLTLANRSDTNNVAAYMELLKAWRDMGGAQDYVLARCHMITRSLCQEAGYGCVRQPEAVALALEVRKRCRECLRNPDGYEIWADY